MPTTQSSLSMKSILLIDAATCLLMGAALLVASGMIACLTGIPQSLLFYAGVLLVPIGLFMAATGVWWRESSFAIWMIILGNVLWVVASLALLSGIIAPNALGVIFILAQAVVVGVLAWLELKAHLGRS